MRSCEGTRPREVRIHTSRFTAWADHTLTGMGERALRLESASYVSASAPGCHVSEGSARWQLGAQAVSKWRRQLNLPGRQSLPELSLEPRSKVLSLVNESDDARVFFVSVCHPCDGLHGALEMGTTRDEDGQTSPCTTLIIQVQPRTVVDACVVRVPRARDVKLDSDIVTLSPEPAATPMSEAESVAIIGFPLPGGPYLCSQGACGALTHKYHASTRYAIDLEASVGTAVLAVARGRVVAVKDGVASGGIHVRGFFAYNALTVEHADAGGGVLFVEYVHVRYGSIRVAVGDELVEGQLIAEVGDAGFCPVAHLHLEAYRECHNTAPSIPIAFAVPQAAHATASTSITSASAIGASSRSAASAHADHNTTFTPVAGGWYHAGLGRVPAPPTCRPTADSVDSAGFADSAADSADSAADSADSAGFVDCAGFADSEDEPTGRRKGRHGSAHTPPRARPRERPARAALTNGNTIQAEFDY